MFTLRNQLLRAGAFGALHGENTGQPQVGLVVDLTQTTHQDFAYALSILASKNQQATLLVNGHSSLKQNPYLTQLNHPRHEFCITGELCIPTLAWLEATTGQAIQLYAAQATHLHRRLADLTQQHLKPIQPSEQLQIGGFWLVKANELEEKLMWARKNGYQLVPVTQLSGLRPATPYDWLRHHYHQLIEEPYRKRSGLITSSERAEAMLYIAPLDHAPQPLPLPYHTPTAELHINSGQLVGVSQLSLLRAYRSQVRTLRDVAQKLEEHPKLKEAQAVFAVTLFTPILEKAGFELLDLPPLRARWYGLGFRILRMVHGTTSAPSNAIPHLAWMPREKFLAKFGR